jgi:hypothetical protein
LLHDRVSVVPKDVFEAIAEVVESFCVRETGASVNRLFDVDEKMHGRREDPILVLLRLVFILHDCSDGFHDLLFFSLSVPLQVRFEAFRDAVVKSVNA